MRIPPERLLAGIARTLVEEVLPHVEPRRARGQLYACVDVLRNLERRVEPARAPLEAEAASIEAALGGAAKALRAVADDARAAPIEAALGGWPSAPTERAAAARAALCEALEQLAGCELATLRAALGGHLARQALRDLAPLAPGSLLEEISHG
jgi:hypothetical protein